MNTQKRHQTALLILAALLTLPVGLRAVDGDTTTAPPTTGFSTGHERANSLHIPADEANTAAAAAARESAAAANPGALDLSGSGSVGLRLNTDSATDTIQAAAFSARDQALGIAERGANEGRMIAGAIENGSARLETEDRADVEKAMHKADQARVRLNQAIERGRNVTEPRWDNARDEIAERYEELADSLEKARDTAVEKGARLDAQSTGSVNSSVRQGT